MGNTPSDHSHDQHVDDEDLDPFDGIETLGYRVLGVQPNSPASAAGLVSFLDFLVGAQEKMLLGSGEGLEPGDEYDDVDLPGLLAEYKGKEMELLVWNIKSQQARLVQLTPADDWGGAGLLGVTIRLDNYAGAEDRLVRVLTVQANSPAAVAGLVPSKDFLLGTTHQTLESVSQLAAVLQEHEDRVVELYVYNVDSDLVRVVALMPTLSWGGGGLLGAEVGTGYLHRLPHTARATEGASVERKVRYVPAPPAPTSGNRSATTAATGGSAAAAAKAQGGRNGNHHEAAASTSDGGTNHSGNNGQQQQPAQQTTRVLELEPQLEMEPSEAGSEENEAVVVVEAAQQHAPRSTSVASSASSNGYSRQQHQGSSEQQPKQQPPEATTNSRSSQQVQQQHASSSPTTGTQQPELAAAVNRHSPVSEPLPNQRQPQAETNSQVQETTRSFSILTMGATPTAATATAIAAPSQPVMNATGPAATPSQPAAAASPPVMMNTTGPAAAAAAAPPPPVMTTTTTTTNPTTTTTPTAAAAAVAASTTTPSPAANAASLVFSQPPQVYSAPPVVAGGQRFTTPGTTTTTTTTSGVPPPVPGSAPPVAAAAAGGLPPPPVMHYYSPPSRMSSSS